MCGVAGVFHYGVPDRPVDDALLAAMTASVAHRGPDAAGTWRAPGIGLGHRRLAILDLSAHAGQPMATADGSHVITYNGEVYNFRALRDELAALGHRFRSTGDTEVVLAGYRAWGPEVARRLSGIFAFAVWDAGRRELFLARDPLGVKPLFYADRERTLRFGSEAKVVLTDPAVSRRPDVEALDAFLTLGYTPAPATGFADVRQLLPGECALVDARGMRRWSYWSCPYPPAPAGLDFAAACREFAARFDAVVAAQMVSDVPLGAFLSGGLDSAAVVRAMQRAAQGRVHALTVGFDVPAFDERPAAERVARALGVVDWTSQEVGLDAAADLLPALSRHVEEPTADSSMLPMYCLAREARTRFTVAMSGDGADEILAGYDTYRATRLARHWRRLPGPVRRAVAALVGRLPPGDGAYALATVLARFVAGAERGPGRDHAAWRIIVDDPVKRRLYAPGFRARVAGADPLGTYAARMADVPATREPLAAWLHADTSFYLPNDMLVKVDRMSMAVGLEVRVPFLAPELVGFCAALPGDYKLHRGRVRKHLLRETLRGAIPDDLLARPKAGFNVPLARWMRGSLRGLLLDAVRTRRDALSAFVRPDEVERLAAEHRDRRADHAHALFAVLMLALWFDNAARAWREGVGPVGT